MIHLTVNIKRTLSNKSTTESISPETYEENIVKCTLGCLMMLAIFPVWINLNDHQQYYNNVIFIWFYPTWVNAMPLRGPIFFPFSVCIVVGRQWHYTIKKDLVNNTHSWSRPTRRWTHNSSRCCTLTDWICSNLSFRIETPDTSQNCPILQSRSQRNQYRCPICQPQQNYINKHNDITYIFWCPSTLENVIMYKRIRCNKILL